MGLYVLKIILLCGIRDDFLDMLNLLGKGDISKDSFKKIVELCKRYSRGSSRNNRQDKWDKLERDVFDRTQKSYNGGATHSEIGNLLENFKIEMMSSISLKIDVLKEKQKQAVEDLTLGVFCPRCRMNHPLRQCLLDKVEVCQLCELNHDTKECPLLPQVKAVMQASTPEVELAYFIAQKKPWQPRNQGMTPDSFPFFNIMSNWNNMQNMNT